jgi:hypothetical protein
MSALLHANGVIAPENRMYSEYLPRMHQMHMIYLYKKAYKVVLKHWTFGYTMKTAFIVMMSEK